MARAITRWKGITILIDQAKPIVSAYQSGRCDLLARVAGRRDVHDDPEIEMMIVETGHAATLRSPPETVR
jgi:hypothetical protein